MSTLINLTFLMKILPKILMLSLCCCFIACTSNIVFEDQKDIPDGGWTYSDTLDFRYSVTDTAWLYNIYLDFSYADSFPHQNIYVQLHTSFPDGKRMSKLKSFDLFSSQGLPLGEGSGQRHQLRTVLQENAFFNQAGDYVLTVEQFTRREALAGISAVGLRVEKTKAR